MANKKISQLTALGANFGAIANKAVAESCCAVGRKLLKYVCNTIEKHFYNAQIIYGDTDSVFVQFDLKNHSKKCHNTLSADLVQKYCASITQNKSIFSIFRNSSNYMLPQIQEFCTCPVLKSEEDKRRESIRLARIAEYCITAMLPYPKQTGGSAAHGVPAREAHFGVPAKPTVGVHQLEYEKTFHPLVLLAKKKYVGKKFIHILESFCKRSDQLKNIKDLDIKNKLLQDKRKALL